MPPVSPWPTTNKHYRCLTDDGSNTTNANRPPLRHEHRQHRVRRLGAHVVDVVRGRGDGRHDRGVRDGGRVVTEDVSLIDLYATLLDLAGIPPATEIPSKTLLSALRSDVPQPIFAHAPRLARSLRLGRYKLIVPIRGPRQLFDRVSDPDETASLFGQAPLLTRYLRNVFGLGVAYRSAWAGGRWGRPNNLAPAFAADHGL